MFRKRYKIILWEIPSVTLLCSPSEVSSIPIQLAYPIERFIGLLHGSSMDESTCGCHHEKPNFVRWLL